MVTFEQAHDAMLQVAQELRGLPVNPIYVELVGSCAIQGQSPNDMDIMVFAEIPGAVDVIVNHLMVTGWTEQEGNAEEYGTGEFRSFRLGDYNLLLVWAASVYASWLASVEICKYIKTTTREQRVAVHQIIMDGGIAANYPPYQQGE